MPIETNKRNGRALTRSITTETITLANLQVGTEIVTAAAICGVDWTVANGTITVARGANNVLVLTEGQDGWDFIGDGAIVKDETASVVVTFSAGAVGTCILILNKKSDGEV
jgi:hypothetical protein